MNPRPSFYVHGTSAREQTRLRVMNKLINEPALREMQLEPGMRIVDVGCGLAHFARAMARHVSPGGSVAPDRFVVGIEHNPDQLSEARRLAEEAGESLLIDLREGDARQLPLADNEWKSFDLVHCRFVLEHIPDPAVAIQEMIKACRPGGRIVLQDDDHDVLRLWPEPDGLRKIWTAYMRSYEIQGNDPFIGRKLVTLLANAGAKPSRCKWLFYGACAGEKGFPFYVQNLIEVLAGARDAMLNAKLIEPTEIDNAMESLHEWSARGDAALWYSICFAEAICE